MSTLHVFAIGGTGSRVLRSLTMLLSCGVKCDMDIRPVIIDPDHSNEDVSRTSVLLQNYCQLRKELSFDTSAKNSFFKTVLQKDGDLRMPLENTNDKRFRDYIELSNLPTESQALMRGLYSDEDLEATMRVGFEGHPNRGSMVLNQMSKTDAFKQFANSYKQGDRIIIVSSIFGGTGASGFPLLLKMLRENKDMQNHSLINNANIGAVSVLPYFKVKQDDNSPIDSATFISKTRSALQYYKRTISDQKKLQCLYYIGENKGKSYENHKGGQEQCNDAHFVELSSALAIVDFANNNYDGQNIHKEFGINDMKQDQHEIIFENLGEKTQKLIRVPLIQMSLLYKLFYNHFDKMSEQTYVLNRGKNFLDEEWVRKFKSFLGDYYCWLEELARNDMSFNPFEFNTGSAKDPLDIVKGTKCKRGVFSKKGFVHFDNVIGKQSSNAGNNIQQFVDNLYDATKQMAENDYIG